MKRILVTAGLLCFFLVGSNVFAQSRISGTVNDASGALIPGVTVTATNVATGVMTTVVSNETGAYNFASLPPGTYKLTSELPGFQGQTYDNVSLGQSDQLRFNFKLTVASVAQAVEVTVDAQAVLTATSASVGEAIEQKKVEELPMVRQDILDLVRIMPGMRVDPFGDQFNALGGIPNNTINTTRDGLSVTDSRNGVLSATTTMNPDSVGEVRVIMAPVDAEYGRGNGQIQVLTRSGTNQFRGAIVYNNRNTKLQANSWVNNEQVDTLTHKWSPTPLNWRNTNQYTLSYGGPIVKNKTFFFALWDQNMSVTKQIVTTPVLTDSARQGIFRYFDNWNSADAHQLPPTFPATPATATIAVVDTAGNAVAPPKNPDGTPYTGSLRCFSVFGNAKIDGSPFTQSDCPGGIAMIGPAWDSLRTRVDPTGYVAKLIAAMPHANYFYQGSTPLGGATGTTVDGLNVAAFRWTQRLNGTQGSNGQGGSAPDTINRKQINLKIDHNFNSEHRLSGSWTFQHDSNDENAPNWPGGFLGNSLRHPQVLTISFVSTLSAAMVNEARYGLNYQYNEVNPAWLLNSNASAYLLQGGKSGAGVTYPVAFTPGAGNFAFGNTLINNNPTYTGSRSPLYDYADTFSYNKGKHALRMGVDLRFGRSAGWNVGTGASALVIPTASGGAGNEPSPLATPIAALPNELSGTQTNAANMLYLLAGSVNAASTPYWISSLKDSQNGIWQDYTTQLRRTREQVYNEWSAFFKDDWKATPSLTFNLGVRYEWYGSPFLHGGYTASVVGQGSGLFGVNRPGATANPFNNWLLAPGNVYLSGYGQNATAATALQCTNTGPAQNSSLPVPSCDPSMLTQFEYVGPGSNHPSHQAIANYWGGFGPAIGLAWQVPWFGAGKTTLRAGFGRTYGIGSRSATTIENAIGNIPGSSLPAALNVANFPQLVNPNRALQLSDLPTVVPVTPSTKPGAVLPIYDRTQTVTAYDPNFKTPYTQTLTLSLTRQVSRTLTVDIRYDGTFGRRRSDGSMNINLPNVYYQPELFNALEVTRAGGDAPLFDQMLAGLKLPGLPAGYGPVGTTANGIVQHGSAAMRRSTSFETDLATGNYQNVANTLNTLTAGVNGLESPPAGVPNISGRVLRNGCDRLADGLTTVGPAINLPLRCFPENYIVANPQLATGSYIGGFGKANYNSMQVQVTMRPTQGLSFQSTYIFARTLGLVPQNWTDPLNRNADYAPPYQDVRHDLRTNGTFELPIGPGKLLMPKSSGLLSRLIEHWQTGFIFNVSSGNPRTVVGAHTLYATGNQNLDSAQNRVDLVAPQLFNANTKGHVQWNPAGNNGFFYGQNKFLTVPDQQCAPGGVTDHVDEMGFNLRNSGFCTLQSIAAENGDGSQGPVIFQNPFPGHRGNMPFGLNAPGQYRFDANLSKKFQISETKALSFRLDALNVFNHAGVGDPQPRTGSSINSPNIIFGQLIDKGVLGSGANPQMRYITGQLRLDF